jgi:hypothetical protein
VPEQFLDSIAANISFSETYLVFTPGYIALIIGSFTTPAQIERKRESTG